MMGSGPVNNLCPSSSFLFWSHDCRILLDLNDVHDDIAYVVENCGRSVLQDRCGVARLLPVAPDDALL